MNILKKADEIVNQNSDIEHRDYGDFTTSMQTTAKIASLMGGKEITTIDCFNIMIAMKLSRESVAHKEDSLLDAVGYIAGLNNFHNGK